jgi:hypothetical protein
VVLDADLPFAWRRCSPRREPGGGPVRDSLPFIVYGGTRETKTLNGWRSLVRNAVVRDIRSPQRLLEQASFFLHRDLAKMPESHLAVLRDLQGSDEALQGKRVMIVDDDVRNIFALSSLLEERGMSVVAHDNGRDAIRYLQASPDIDVVLMDIMMPRIDGIDTIRENPQDTGVQGPADHCRHREGDEGRSRKMHGSRCLGLSVQARRHRAHDRRARRLVAALGQRAQDQPHTFTRTLNGRAGAREGEHPHCRRQAGQSTWSFVRSSRILART